MPHITSQSQRIVTAPLPSPISANLPPNRLFSVVLEADEDVEWTWMHTPDGVSYVSGYTVLKKASGAQGL